MQGKVCLVTGATAGIGAVTAREVARLGATVIGVSRNPDKCAVVTERIITETGNPQVEFLSADLSSQAQVRRLAEAFKQKHARLDVLVNNAGIYLDADRSVITLSLEVLRTTLETNTFGALRTCQAFLPLMKEHHYGRIVNVSSTMGQHAHMGNMSAAYRISKDATW